MQWTGSRAMDRWPSLPSAASLNDNEEDGGKSEGRKRRQKGKKKTEEGDDESVTVKERLVFMVLRSSYLGREATIMLPSFRLDQRAKTYILVF